MTGQSEILRACIRSGTADCKCMPFFILDQVHQYDCLWNNMVLEIYRLERKAECLLEKKQ